MTHVLVVRNDVTVPPGYLAGVLDARPGVSWDLVALDTGDPVPELGDADAFVLLGGEMGAYDEAEYPYLVDEKQLVVAAAKAGIPLLGICLGCQLAADALGGSAFRAPELEAYFGGCDLTTDGEADPMIRLLTDPVLSLHQDTWSPPPGAAVLARTDRYPQAFRLGNVVGIQPHPEVTPTVAAAWIDDFGSARIASAGTDPDQLREAVRRSADRSRTTAHAVFDAWLDEVIAHTAP